MKGLWWVLLLCLGVSCAAQTRCDPAALPLAAGQVLAAQNSLRQSKLDEMIDLVPAAVAGQMVELKAALSRASDAALACFKPSVLPGEVEVNLAKVLHANAPEPADGFIAKDDHRYDEIVGSYGYNLRVQVSRPASVADVLVVQYSINIECGADSMLLVYEVRDGEWRQRLRWQAPPLKSISDAFGDFFVWTFLHDTSRSGRGHAAWRMVVAHGTTWCTSRFSNFKIDLLSPDSDPASPRVVWHSERGYSRGDFESRIKAWGDTFELRVNADCMAYDTANCFERRVIYRYAVGSDGDVRRVGPLGLNARGFVTEWLEAPWVESAGFSSAESADELHKVYTQLNRRFTPDDGQFMTKSYGPVRGCSTPGIFQVQFDTTLERIIPGRPGGESTPLASHYFRVRETKDGYLMLSTATQPDPDCVGVDLMAAGR
jgi:hypothetical protein